MELNALYGAEEMEKKNKVNKKVMIKQQVEEQKQA